MELDRHRIERRDFEVVRRGYDQNEVDMHLRELADAIAELKAEMRSAPAGVAGAAAEHVRTIVEAAEQSAAEIQAKAEEEARRLLDDSTRIARETRDRADHDSAEQIRRVQEATVAMLERADALEHHLETMLDGIQGASSSLVESLRTGAGELEGELGELRQGLLSARPIRVSTSRRATEDGADAGIASEAGARDAAPEPFGAERSGRFSVEAAEEGGAERPPDLEPEVLEQVEELIEEGQHHHAPAAAASTERLAPAGAADPNEGGGGAEGARLIALNMALNGTPREEAARYLSDNFELEDQNAILDDVYSRVGSRS